LGKLIRKTKTKKIPRYRKRKFQTHVNSNTDDPEDNNSCYRPMPFRVHPHDSELVLSKQRTRRYVTINDHPYVVYSRSWTRGCVPVPLNVPVHWIRKPDSLDAIITDPVTGEQCLLTNVYIKSIGGFV